MENAAGVKVSMIIPVYNEESHLQDFIDQIYSVSFDFEPEFIFVDDGSSDGSWNILSKLEGRDNTIIYKQPYNQGKGAGIRKGFSLATGSIMVVQDADFEYDPRELNSLVKPIVENRADVVYGSRFMQSNPQVHRTYHYLANLFLTMLSNMLSGLYLTDMETCYKIFRSEIIKNIHLECNRFGFEPEITAKLSKLKLRLHEYPISYFPRTYDEGKKINWKDGVAAIWYILKFNLSSLDSHTKKQIPQSYLVTSRQWL